MSTKLYGVLGFLSALAVGVVFIGIGVLFGAIFTTKNIDTETENVFKKEITILQNARDDLNHRVSQSGVSCKELKILGVEINQLSGRVVEFYQFRGALHQTVDDYELVASISQTETLRQLQLELEKCKK